MKLLIKNGFIVDPKNNIYEKKDLLISDGKIEKIEKNIDMPVETIDANNLIVCPGFIDMHVHFREPGMENKENIVTCSNAAARGGITTIVGMPNTKPPADNKLVIKYIIEKSKSALVNVYPTGCLTKKMEGKEMSEIFNLKKAGVIALSDDGKGIQNPKLMRNILEYLKQFNLPVILHEEDELLAGIWTMNEGKISTELGVPAKPAEAEEIMIARDIILSKMTNYPIHITHINSEGSYKLIHDAKKRNLKITCDTCPHYFTLTEEAVIKYGANAKMNPPLRTEKDVEAIIQGLKDGTIDAISTDHAPHLLTDKMNDFESCENGIIGLETSIPLVMTYLYHKKIIDLKRIVELMSYNPSKILKLENKGHLSIGADADITIIDANKEEIIDKEKFESKGRNTPFHGWKLKGIPVYTIVKGKIVMKNRKIIY